MAIMGGDILYNKTLDDVKRLTTDPVYFTENKIKVAGFPLILRPRVAEFMYRLNREQEITDHDLARGEGMTTGILAYMVFKAIHKTPSVQIIMSPRFEESMERLIHVAAMARSTGLETVRTVGRDVEFQNGSVIKIESINGFIGWDGLTDDEKRRGLECSTVALDGFSRLSEGDRAHIAYSLSAGFLGDKVQTILV